ncbi:LOW QUALITY PROTEIN: pleckstrin homology domain-containing family G member 3 [Thalassophryne amazonica]|uniref:LOW QUALITY PROTEIN: pleckstrin homology domain-containing family G member 3 n=1 Tax=Thalassophryne amazonica TaxID=390379 RepID=UPI001470CBDE|nr:LOW QUALITY PROTEIN: pleckstrin homology domain-containing family G member 3 [Thalassophryne amazonica]
MNMDSDSECLSRTHVEPQDGESERPVSLVSTLSSSSSPDSRSLFGSMVALPSSNPPPTPSEDDIDLELCPAESTGSQAREQSPAGLGSSGCWQEQLEPSEVQQQWNNNNTTSSRKHSEETFYFPSSPVIAGTMVTNPKLTYVDRVVMEIIETERMYVRDLRSIVEDYLAHIIDTGNLPMQPEQVCALFGNIEDIYEFNSELLQALDLCGNDPVSVARCFVEKSEYFEIYTQYCTNYPNSVATLTNCMRSKPLAKFFRERQAALKRSLPLGSYLLKPVQRILKYHLLLQEIANHFDPDEEGYEVVQEAIDTMMGVAWYINDMKRKHEHAVRVQEIQSLLINWKGSDLTTYGELVLEGTFHVLRAKNTRTLFLFERMLLITKKRAEHYVYKIHISCSTLMLLDSAKDPLLFSVIHFRHPKQPHTVQAKCVDEKVLWCHHIKRLILENHHTKVPQKAKEAMLENSAYPRKYHYGPEKLKKSSSCNSQDFNIRRRNDRRKSEPVKQIMRNTKAVLKHADSEGTLLREKCELQPTSSVTVLTSSPVELLGQRSHLENLGSGIDSQQQLSLCDRDPKLDSSPSEGGLEEGESFKEDVLMGDDQVADFASSVLAAISCWHYRARALLSTHFTTDDQIRDSTEMTSKEESEILSQVSEEELCPEDLGLPTNQSHQLEVNYCQLTESCFTASQLQESVTSETDGASFHETGEGKGESDSSSLQAEETSELTNRMFLEEDEEVLSDHKSNLPSSVLSEIAEHFTSSPSGWRSLVSDDLSSLARPSSLVENDTVSYLSDCLDQDEKTQEFSSDSSPPLVEPDHSTLIPDPEQNPFTEEERRSTLSKQDRLLIHKIRRYYEHAEDQDATFSIKRRESLSYIPAGLVRHLSRQINSIPQEVLLQVQRRSPSRNRPTSWSVFDLPGLEKSHTTETQPVIESQGPTEPRLRSQSVTDASTSDEEFRPSSEMLKVWQDMDVNTSFEEIQVHQTVDEDVHSVLELSQRDDVSSEKLVHVLEECDISTAADGSSVLSPGTSFPSSEEKSDQDFDPCKNPTAQEDNQVTSNTGTSMDQDQILQGTGKIKNKVFHLARQYSQRIKNNRPPMMWQRNRDTKNIPLGHKDQRNNGKLNLTLHLNSCKEAIIPELRSPSVVHTPTSGTSSHGSFPCPQSPESETFQWPDVQELRSKYTSLRLETGTSHPLQVTQSYTVPGGMLGHLSCSSLEASGCSRSCNTSPNSYSTMMASPEAQSRTLFKGKALTVDDWPKPQSHRQLQPPLCRWSSLDHILPLHEVQNFEKPLRTFHKAGQGSAITRETGKTDVDDLLQESSGKISKTNLVKNLRDKFQNLSLGL